MSTTAPMDILGVHIGVLMVESDESHAFLALL